MPKPHNPRQGSMQFWPRKRTKHSLARIRSWAADSKVKPLGFIGYKAGMTHLQVIDNRPKSLTKGDKIVAPVTIIECPAMIIVGVSFYKKSLLGLNKSTSVLAEKCHKTAILLALAIRWKRSRAARCKGNRPAAWRRPKAWRGRFSRRRNYRPSVGSPATTRVGT